ncbi:hypothetical protein LY13_003997 [Prauserella aidingensis]|uniref:hypothetical protein n=1 Tax=Prauserella aidingensis TaxID=387890 RepID=UPI0020A43DDA|nr:hypothetical protein [Prauserella aidingensis]MCP2255223.1 hypothetical protein [Prauserella aidingensis]
MHTARITDGTAREAVEVASDEYIYAAQKEERAMDEREEVDRLLEDVDRELAEEEEMAEWRARRRFNDVQRIHRARRRAEREQLDLLTRQHPPTTGVAPSGKSTATALRSLAEQRLAGGEVAA